MYVFSLQVSPLCDAKPHGGHCILYMHCVIDNISSIDDITVFD